MTGNPSSIVKIDDEHVLVDLALRAGINFQRYPSGQWVQFIVHAIRYKVRVNSLRPWFTRFLLFFSKSKSVVIESFCVRIVYKELLDMVFFMSIEDTSPFHPNCKCCVGGQ